MRLPRRLLPLLAALALVAAGSLLAPPARAAATCGTTTATDEWPTFGRDVTNSRTQQAAGDVSPATVRNLTPAWTFNTGASAGSGDLNGTPIVSGGCVFLNTAGGRIVALNADTGALVWEHHVTIPAADTGLGSGVFISSPVVDPVTRQLYALVSRSGAPSVIALDLADGTVRGEHTIIEGNGYYTQATPVIAGRVLIVGFSPVEGDPNERGGVALFQLPPTAQSSAPWRRTVVYTIPDADFENPPHYAGGGIWTSPAVDLAGGYAYAGTSNPYSKKVEHPNTNAILKIDVDPDRDTYGTIVGSYKGLIEQYDEHVRDLNQPVCDAVGDQDVAQEPFGDSTGCLQLDLDFGASPNLFHASDGTLLVGDLQKAGVYHAARADTMAPVWKTVVGGSCAPCNAAAWAFDGSPIGVSSPGTTMFSLARDTGTPQWASPVADGTHYQSTSIAGGVVFTVDNYGNLLAFDEATGAPITKRPILLDANGGSAASLSSAGVAIARGRIYAASGTTVVAYAPSALPIALP